MISLGRYLPGIAQSCLSPDTSNTDEVTMARCGLTMARCEMTMAPGH